jgi:predicted small lipoprotein YifL
MLKRIFIASTSLLVLVACGYKGPLYLPKNQPTTSSSANNAFAPKINTIESTQANDKAASMIPANLNESKNTESSSIESRN